jgi:hypothetical protein
MAYGKEELFFVKSSQYLTVDGTSDTVTLPTGTIAVRLHALSNCWVAFGTAPTAVKPGAEKTVTGSFYLPLGTPIILAVPMGTDEAPMKVAAIQDTASAALHVTALEG